MSNASDSISAFSSIASLSASSQCPSTVPFSSNEALNTSLQGISSEDRFIHKRKEYIRSSALRLSSSHATKSSGI
ncbi:hypothetical protein V501_00813 [Pseudogymnoascus sp. VKM F-4519 (FW-2642)]|nr:hypothetical protein V501_00813 [Pseudogymnoascus sp. VKM F-4519 (FW-2642)]